MKKTFLKALILSALFLLQSCGEDDSVVRYRVPKRPTAQAPVATPSQAGNSHAGHNHPEFTWTAPENWQKGQGNAMRLATFKIAVGDEVADCSILKLGGEGGGLTGNINRWLGQLNLEHKSAAEIKEMAQSMQAPVGDFLFYHLVNDKNEKQAFLASIFFLQGKTLFVKLSASKDATNQLKKEFVAFCQSISEYTH